MPPANVAWPGVDLAARIERPTTKIPSS
jgi:hypothetical protein